MKPISTNCRWLPIEHSPTIPFFVLPFFFTAKSWRFFGASPGVVMSRLWDYQFTSFQMHKLTYPKKIIKFCVESGIFVFPNAPFCWEHGGTNLSRVLPPVVLAGAGPSRFAAQLAGRTDGAPQELDLQKVGFDGPWDDQNAAKMFQKKSQRIGILLYEMNRNVAEAMFCKKFVGRKKKLQRLQLQMTPWVAHQSLRPTVWPMAQRLWRTVAVLIVLQTWDIHGIFMSHGWVSMGYPWNIHGRFIKYPWVYHEYLWVSRGNWWECTAMQRRHVILMIPFRTQRRKTGLQLKRGREQKRKQRRDRNWLCKLCFREPTVFGILFGYSTRSTLLWGGIGGCWESTQRGWWKRCREAIRWGVFEGLWDVERVDFEHNTVRRWHL